MAISNIMTAMTAGKSIVSNLPLAEEAHFQFLEQNPSAAAMLSKYAESSVANMLKTIPIGREAEYIEMTQRAFKAFQLPENSPELVSFVEMYDVGYTPQMKPANTPVNFSSDNSKSAKAARIVISVMLLFLVALPTLLFIFDDKPGLAIAIFLVISILTLRRFFKKLKQSGFESGNINVPPARIIKDLESERAPEISTRTQHIPKADQGRQGKIAEPERNIAEESPRPGHGQRYARHDDQKRYRK